MRLSSLLSWIGCAGPRPAARSSLLEASASRDSLSDRGLSASVHVRSTVKWLLFPGLDLHTRCRYRFLPQFFLSGPIATLDAGCGNGALAYAAYRLGNRVLGITADEGEVRRNRQLFTCREIGSD